MEDCCPGWSRLHFSTPAGDARNVTMTEVGTSQNNITNTERRGRHGHGGPDEHRRTGAIMIAHADTLSALPDNIRAIVAGVPRYTTTPDGG